MQFQRIPKRSHPNHNARGALYHNKKGSPILKLKRRPTPATTIEESANQNKRGAETKRSVDPTATRVEPHVIKIQ